ncbi:MAG: two-component regulator propeller domain-containing protein [Bacteroidales bacterium]
MIKKIFLFLFSLLSLSLTAQSIGEWTVYSPSGKLTAVEESNMEVFGVAGGSLFSYFKKEGELMQYSKKEGMSDADVAFIRYDRKNETLVIVYKNQNIDLLKEGRFYNIPDFKDKIMTVDKTVNNLSVQDGFAYLSTAFGAVEVDIERQEIANTYNLGFNAMCTFRANGNICIGRTGGIMACPEDKNPYDIINWISVSYLNLTNAILVEGDLFGIASDGQLFRIKADWSEDRLIKNGYTSIKNYKEWIYLAHGNGVDVYNSKTNQNKPIGGLTGTADVSSFAGTDIWVTTSSGLTGLREKKEDWTVIQENIIPNAPWVRDPYNMRLRHGRLYVTTGGPFRIFDDISGVVSILNNDSWTNITESDVRESIQAQFRQLQDIEISPVDPEVFYVGSFTGGVYEFKDGKCINRYAGQNNELNGADGNKDHVWVSSLKMDDDGNLWMLNSKVPSPLRLKTADGKWYKYQVGTLGLVEDLYPLLITKHTRRPQKWFLSYYNELTLNVLDDKGTFENVADDESVTYRSLTDQDGNTYRDISFRSLLEDRDGKMWIGTSVGPMIIQSPENIFSSEGRCTRIKIPRNDGTGLADYLLDNVSVICMAVDAANRKWIGTSGNGVYLLSADGTETIHHFTAENSPLPSNEILSMVLDEATGKLYVGCQKGLVAYQSDAVEGKADFSNVYAFPNPVRPEYAGNITVTGLMANTLVKITDVNNNLIYQDYSLGGQFTWDGLNKKGDRVKSGVYLVYGSAADGKEGVVTKILIVR